MNRTNFIFSAFVLHSVIIGVLLLSVSCSKSDKQPPFVYEDQRIASIRNKFDGKTTSFAYDNEKRLTRIDFNYDGNASIRFEYALPVITVQYYKGAAPDITKEKYTFTTLNGRVVNYRMTRPDGTIYDTYLEYDNSDRMIEVGQRGITNTGSLFMSMDCYISYNAQNSTQQLRIYGARGIQGTDSVTIIRTFDPQTDYFTFQHIGFNYFGSFSTGVAYTVAGINDVIVPFPFFVNGPGMDDFPMITAKNTIKKLETNGKARDLTAFPPNNDWMDVSGVWQTPNGFYKYDDMGRLAEENGKYLFTWK